MKVNLKAQDIDDRMAIREVLQGMKWHTSIRLLIQSTEWRVWAKLKAFNSEITTLKLR